MWRGMRMMLQRKTQRERRKKECLNKMFRSFLIKYGEIGVKGKNRYMFEDALMKQIKYALEKCGR